MQTEQETEYERLQQRSRRQRLYELLVAGVMIAAVVASVILLVQLKGNPPSERLQALPSTEAPVTNRDFEGLALELRSLKANTDTAFRTLSKGRLGEVQAVELERINSQLDDFAQRLSRLEGAIARDPEKALSLPMLRKDIDSMQIRIAEQRAVAVVEVERLYSVMLWALGIMAGLLGVLVSGAVALRQGWMAGGRATWPE